ncbi:MAG: T9SS type A sorting domain-containing protein [Chitinophagaceae bacterium]|nr:T9SS type A sorting domain-containing protein [Chitinophagaceae bacterium]
MKRIWFLLFFLVEVSSAQQNIVMYAGNAGREGFYDITELSNGTFLLCGYAENLNWINASVPKTQLTYTGSIPNGLGSNRYGIILQLSPDLKNILQVVHFPQGAVEDIRFIKSTNMPYATTGDLFISCNTSDIDANNGGYLIARLDKNFLNGIPTSLSWFNVVWAKGYAKAVHPWDVTNQGEVYYVSGESHGYDWSAMYCLNSQGKRRPVSNWRTHWLKNGTEWKGTPASANPFGQIDSVNYSGIVFKITGRCELRSWNMADFNSVQSDGNGGTRKGKWPADFLFNSPCDPQNPSANSPGYTGYSPEACCPVWGASSIAVDRRNNNVYLGMNFKSYYNPGSTPDFEPAVIAMDSTGQMKWWSRLYHEITPSGDTMGSIPDQYVDALAIDYSSDNLVVAARAHGNNVENLWEGDEILASPSAKGFQNRFTGSNGNIHESWLGKLDLTNGTLKASTYVAELAEGTGGLGTPHPDPNLDNWPDPNTGWPDVNTTYIGKNSLKISSNGDVCMLGVGRRTITTKNAYQKMVLPTWGGKSCWNSFVRMYNTHLGYPKYSSLVVGQWDTLTQTGGDNTELFGMYKTSKGVIAVGRSKADASNVALGNALPVTNIPSWGMSSANGESAILVYYTTDSLFNSNDQPLEIFNQPANTTRLQIYPNPTSHSILLDANIPLSGCEFIILDMMGRVVKKGSLTSTWSIDVTELNSGIYCLNLTTYQGIARQKFIKD